MDKPVSNTISPEVSSADLQRALFEFMSDQEGIIAIEHQGETSVPKRISRYLGRACVRAAQDDRGRADLRVKEAREIMESNVDAPRLQRFQLELLDTYGDIVQFANQSPEAIKEIRQNFHNQVIDQLIEAQRRVFDGKSNTHKQRAKRNDWLGHMNELSTLAVLNRQVPNNVIAVPALSHHNASTRPEENYDILAIVSPGSGESVATKVQVKSTNTGKGSLKCYADDVFVLYATESFGNEHSWMNPEQRERFPAAQQLIREHYGTATAEDIDSLNMTRDSIINQMLAHQASLTAAAS